ncbi:MAG: oligosaccharide flippase family protein [Acidobacteriaceae bacterium]|nr:oligosaccharide flippase family protein [Acidobacteriaceae bacterium]
MLHGGASGLIAKLFAVLMSAVSLPLTVRYLGKLEYGLWVTISTTVVMLAVLDLGIANTLTTQIAMTNAEDDQPRAKAYFASAFWSTTGICAILAFVFYGVWSLINWGHLLHVTDPVLVSHTRGAVLAAGLFFFASMPLTLANRVLCGYQEVHLSNYFGIFSNFLNLVAVIGGILMHANLLQLILCYCGAGMIGNLVLNAWLLFYHRPYLKPNPRLMSTRIARELFKQGTLFFLLQLTGLVVFNSDNLIITHYLGPDQVTPYSIAWRLISYASMLQSIMIPSFWPAFTEAYFKGDIEWVRKTHSELVRKTLLAVSAVALCMALFGRTLIYYWAGPAAVPSHALMWAMAGWAVLVSATTNQALLLTAVNRLGVEAGAAIVSAVANLVFSIFLVQRVGAIGAVIGTSLSFLIFMVAPQEWEVRRVLSGRFLPKRNGQEMKEIAEDVLSGTSV